MKNSICLAFIFLYSLQAFAGLLERGLYQSESSPCAFHVEPTGENYYAEFVDREFSVCEESGSLVLFEFQGNAVYSLQVDDESKVEWEIIGGKAFVAFSSTKSGSGEWIRDKGSLFRKTAD
jgi:hypothetical protein